MSGWVLLVGIAWIVVMTWICYRGVELSAILQQIFLMLELIVLAIFVVTAFVKVAGDNAGPQAIGVAWSWFNPLDIPTSHPSCAG